MTVLIRSSIITNVTGALIAPSSATTLINSGQDHAIQIVSRTLTSAEAGAMGGAVYGIGTIRDNTVPFVLGTNGFLFAQFQGAPIKNVCIELWRPSTMGAGGSVPCLYQVTGASPGGPTKIEWAAQYINNIASLYMWDASTGVATPNTQSNALQGDTIIATVTLGNF